MSDSKQQLPNSRYEHLAGGLTGGFVSTLIFHPLDLLKVRFAANEGNSGIRPAYGSYAKAVKTIIQTEGSRAFYKGLTPNLTGNALAWGLYFQLFNDIKRTLSDENSGNIPAPYHLLAGVLSGIGTLTVTNPIWVAKTRLCLQYENSPKNYSGMMNVMETIYRKEGIRGWYKGFGPGLIGTSHGGIQFMAYYELRKIHSRYTGIDFEAKLVIDTLEGPLSYILMAGMSKTVAVATTYPYQVVRTRLQDQHVKYDGAMDVIRKTYSNENIFGFYKGILPSLVRVVPATAVTFLVYENVSHAVRAAFPPPPTTTTTLP